MLRYFSEKAKKERRAQRLAQEISPCNPLYLVHIGAFLHDEFADLDARLDALSAVVSIYTYYNTAQARARTRDDTLTYRQFYLAGTFPHSERAHWDSRVLLDLISSASSRGKTCAVFLDPVMVARSKWSYMGEYCIEEPSDVLESYHAEVARVGSRVLLGTERISNSGFDISYVGSGGGPIERINGCDSEFYARLRLQ